MALESNGRGGSRPGWPRRLECAETFAGNEGTATLVEVPGLLAWVHSRPAGPGRLGGDVHYISLCPNCAVSRIATAFDGKGTGSSGVRGIRTKVLAGDPSTSGRYSILLFVPPHTTIAAHSHRDDRVASVVGGEWRLGYGETFAEASLKTLPPGSVYTEPAGVAHFARTGAESVIVQITGLGAADTRYVDPASDPTKR